MPSHLQDILDWREKGIKNVVVLTTDYEIEEVWGHVDYYFKVLEEAGIKYTWSPIKDGEAPRIGQFNEILNFIRRVEVRSSLSSRYRTHRNYTAVT